MSSSLVYNMIMKKLLENQEFFVCKCYKLIYYYIFY
jgi:hypothetical protein